jgi:hypothetical protein
MLTFTSDSRPGNFTELVSSEVVCISQKLQ